MYCEPVLCLIISESLPRGEQDSEVSEERMQDFSSPQKYPWPSNLNGTPRAVGWVQLKKRTDIRDTCQEVRPCPGRPPVPANIPGLSSAENTLRDVQKYEEAKTE